MFKRLFALPLATFAIAAAALLVGQAQAAPVKTDDIKVGDVLDESGIQLHGIEAFNPPLPLPPGKWEVVGRLDYTSKITLMMGQPGIAQRTSLTLLNRDVSGAIRAILVTFTPDVEHIAWSNTECIGNASTEVNAFGTTKVSKLYGCVRIRHPEGSLRKWVLDSSVGTDDLDKKRLQSLVPHVDLLPESYGWVGATFNLSPGRSIGIQFFTSNQDAKKWVPEMGSSYLKWLGENSTVVVPAFGQ